MRIVYSKQLNSEEELVVLAIAKKCGISFDTARLLFYRGADTPDKAERFLAPGKENFHDTFLLDGMLSALERIELAKIKKENVLIFGDYDADGICATTVLYSALKEFGITARFVIPERDDGYGLNLEIIERLNKQQQVDLVITVDCGISDYEKVETLRTLGIDVIVTDHHEPPEILPSCTIINPKKGGQAYPFTELCGAGVAYKLAVALIGDKADKYLDFVAIATIADSMELVGENRDIVTEGLKLFKDMRPCFNYLLGEKTKDVTAQTITYGIAPRINAGGRMGDANASLRLFTTEDDEERFNLSVKLNEYNLARQVECDNIYQQAKEKIIKYNRGYDAVIVVYDESWKTGFVGIVAARLVEDFGRPVIVFAGQDGHLKGSARSIDGVNIHEALTAVSDTLLSFGGHAQAAGAAVEINRFNEFRQKLNSYVLNHHAGKEYMPTVYAEWQIDSPVSVDFAKEIERLEPFGVGNRRPQFAVEIDEVQPFALKNGSPHYSFKTNFLEMLWFNIGEVATSLRQPVKKTVVFEINRSVYKNKESVKGYVRNVSYDYTDLSRLKLHVFENEVKKLKTDVFASKVFPATDEDFKPTGLGTLYVVSDTENLKLYPQLENLPRHLFKSDTKALNDCVIISPSEIPQGFKKVVYLDKPICVLGQEVFVAQNVLGYKAFDRVSTDRNVFADIYGILRSLVGKAFASSASVFEKYNLDCDGYQFVFSTEVFLELGIFYTDCGILKQNINLKNTLTNSKVYSKICSIR